MEFNIEAIQPDPNNRPFEPDFPGKRNPWDKIKHPFNYYYIQSIIERVDSENNRPPKYDESKRQEVYRLFAKGLTLRQISEATGVSKSTACLWTQQYRETVASVTALVTQPGTDKVISTEYSLNEVNLGKLKTKTRGRKKKLTS
jgi:hypothetical protein